MRRLRTLVIALASFGVLAAGEARAGDYVLNYDLSVIPTATLTTAAKTGLRTACLNEPATSSGLLKVGREQLRAPSLYSPEMRLALFGVSERDFAESRPLKQELQTPAGQVPLGALDVVVVPVGDYGLAADVSLAMSSPLTNDYPAIAHAASLVVGKDGGRTVTLIPVPGRSDVTYLLRLAITPTQ